MIGKGQKIKGSSETSNELWEVTFWSQETAKVLKRTLKLLLQMKGWKILRQKNSWGKHRKSLYVQCSVKRARSVEKQRVGANLNTDPDLSFFNILRTILRGLGKPTNKCLFMTVLFCFGAEGNFEIVLNDFSLNNLIYGMIWPLFLGNLAHLKAESFIQEGNKISKWTF